MRTYYPSFESLEVKREYTDKIRNLFHDHNLNWAASASATSSHIFITPKDSIHWHKYLHLTRASLHTKEGVLSFGVSGSFSSKDSLYKEILEDKGYSFQENPDPKGRWWLLKNLDELELLPWEIKDLESILVKK